MNQTGPVIDFHVHFLVREVLEQSLLPSAVITNYRRICLRFSRR